MTVSADGWLICGGSDFECGVGNRSGEKLHHRHHHRHRNLRATMSIRAARRALQLRGQSQIPKIFILQKQGCAALRFYSGALGADNPASAAHQVATSQPTSKGRVPFTIESHKEVKRNPNLVKEVLFTLV